MIGTITTPSRAKAMQGWGDANEANSSPPLGSLEQWQIDAIKRIISLTMLPNGWDGHGGPPPTEKVAGWAIQLIATTELYSLTPPEFSPESGGALQITWWSGFQRELEFHILNSGIIEVLRVDGNQMLEGQFSMKDRERLQTEMNWLRR